MTVEESAAAAGLDRAAVRARVDAGQVNAAPPAPGRTVAQILRANALTRFNAILGAMFVVVVVVGPVQDALFSVGHAGRDGRSDRGFAQGDFS